MSDPSPSLALDRTFPPDECVWEEEADRYVKTGWPGESVVHHGGYLPYFGMGVLASQTNGDT